MTKGTHKETKTKAAGNGATRIKGEPSLTHTALSAISGLVPALRDESRREAAARWKKTSDATIFRLLFT